MTPTKEILRSSQGFDYLEGGSRMSRSAPDVLAPFEVAK